ncbi:hypothetical protein AAMO2058_000096900 [Amorphochlora amoebiformis]
MASPVQGEGEIGEGDGEGSREMYVYAPTTKNYYTDPYALEILQSDDDLQSIGSKASGSGSRPQSPIPVISPGHSLSPTGEERRRRTHRASKSMIGMSTKRTPSERRRAFEEGRSSNKDSRPLRNKTEGPSDPYSFDSQISLFDSKLEIEADKEQIIPPKSKSPRGVETSRRRWNEGVSFRKLESMSGSERVALDAKIGSKSSVGIVEPPDDGEVLQVSENSLPELANIGGNYEIISKKDFQDDQQPNKDTKGRKKGSFDDNAISRLEIKPQDLRWAMGHGKLLRCKSLSERVHFLSSMRQEMISVGWPIAMEIINENHDIWRARMKTIESFREQSGSNLGGLAIPTLERNESEARSLKYKPLNFGGLAGGTKFFAEGFLFKLSTDPQLKHRQNTFLYGGDMPDLDRAAKSAAHELHGVNSFYSIFLKHNIDVQVPWQILYDYRGFRMVAMPYLPIGESVNSELIHGSDDQGRTIHNRDSKFNEYMRMAAKELNLALHNVHGTMLYTGGDVEGHRTEKEWKKGYNYYLLDLARWAPPECPYGTTHLQPDQSSIFYRMLRPEFLMREAKGGGLPALSSDTFSGWGKYQSKEHSKNLLKATEHMLTVVVKKVVASIMKEAMLFDFETISSDITDHKVLKFPDTLNIAGMLHQAGLPIRHLLLVLLAVRKNRHLRWERPKKLGDKKAQVDEITLVRRTHALAVSKLVQSRIEAEMISRSIKHKLKKILRASEIVDVPRRLARFLNAVMGAKHRRKECEHFWNSWITRDLMLSFGFQRYIVNSHIWSEFWRHRRFLKVIIKGMDPADTIEKLVQDVEKSEGRFKRNWQQGDNRFYMHKVLGTLVERWKEVLGDQGKSISRISSRNWIAQQLQMAAVVNHGLVSRRKVSSIVHNLKFDGGRRLLNEYTRILDPAYIPKYNERDGGKTKMLAVLNEAKIKIMKQQRNQSISKSKPTSVSKGRADYNTPSVRAGESNRGGQSDSQSNDGIQMEGKKMKSEMMASGGSVGSENPDHVEAEPGGSTQPAGSGRSDVGNGPSNVVSGPHKTKLARGIRFSFNAAIRAYTNELQNTIYQGRKITPRLIEELLHKYYWRLYYERFCSNDVVKIGRDGKISRGSNTEQLELQLAARRHARLIFSLALQSTGLVVGEVAWQKLLRWGWFHGKWSKALPIKKEDVVHISMQRSLVPRTKEMDLMEWATLLTTLNSVAPVKTWEENRKFLHHAAVSYRRLERSGGAHQDSKHLGGALEALLEFSHAPWEIRNSTQERKDRVIRFERACRKLLDEDAGNNRIPTSGFEGEVANRVLTLVSLAWSSISAVYINWNLTNQGLRDLPRSIANYGATMETLDLGFNSLRALTRLGRLCSLKILRLAGNHLEQLPNTIGLLKNLTELDFSENSIKSLPSCIGGLSKLKRLNARRNNIEFVPSSYKDLQQLMHLDLGLNCLRSLCVEVSGLKALRTLTIDGNPQLSSVPLDSLARLSNIWRIKVDKQLLDNIRTNYPQDSEDNIHYLRLHKAFKVESTDDHKLRRESDRGLAHEAAAHFRGVRRMNKSSASVIDDDISPRNLPRTSSPLSFGLAQGLVDRRNRASSAVGQVATRSKVSRV